MDASGACKYCGTSFDGLPYRRNRITCGSHPCKIKYMAEYQHDLDRSTRDKSPGGPSRTWGSFTIPSKQDKLNEAMVGQVMYCPNCGYTMAVQVDQHQRCGACNALWTVSWGRLPHGDVCVARLDRWS